MEISGGRELGMYSTVSKVERMIRFGVEEGARGLYTRKALCACTDGVTPF